MMEKFWQSFQTPTGLPKNVSYPDFSGMIR